MDAVIYSLISITAETSVLAKELRQNKKRKYEELSLALSKKMNRTKRQKIENYVEDIVFSYSLDDFQSHFRLSRNSTEEVIKLINTTRNEKKMGRPSISTDKEVLLSIWTLANQESFRGISDRFGLSKGHAYRSFMNFCNKMSSMLSNFIKWPSNNLDDTVHKFEQLRKIPLPGVVGCVDGTHIFIKAPKKDSQSYYNRKGRHSILLQIICDAEMQIIDAFVGWPGSSNDSRVWKQSPIYNLLLQEPKKYLGNSYYLLGDSAYPLDTFLLVPFKDYGTLTIKEKTYNKRHSSVRVVVEQTIGLLKGRFRRLKYLDMENIAAMSKVVMTACILHNLCIKKGEKDIPEDILLDNHDGDDDDDCDDFPERTHNRASAVEKRNRIADFLMEK
ncbi:putative nuclease HARBI1 [Centruroides vittatus]|uniref:putative nuclease HARBI1 n=1 Tax=Centruroides vittatus TaxID=120091 RepID=UPI0035100FE9